MASNNSNKRFMIIKPMTIHTGLLGYEYNDDRAQVFPNGILIIKEGACSDGVSPTFRLGRLGVFGPPNGPLDLDTGLPITAPAVFAHDILLEIRKETGMSAKEIHWCFGHLIMDTKFILRGLYRFMAKHFGPRD